MPELVNAPDPEAGTEESPRASEAGLSIDEAVGLMAPDAQADEAAAETSEPPATEGEADEDAEVAPPPFWRAQDKAWFAEQPPEVKDRILAYEKHRDAATARALREAAEARKAARAEAQALAGRGGEIAQLAHEARAAFAQSDWDSIDWIAWAETDPQGALRGKLQYEAEREQLQRLDAARQAAEDQAFRSYVEEQAQALHALAPELAADETRRRDVGLYLLGQGYGPETLRGVSALDLSLAQKAMLWDRANDQLRAGAAPGAQGRARTPQPASRAVRPGAAAATPSTRRQTEEASTRFAQTRSKEDAIRLLTMRGQ